MSDVSKILLGELVHAMGGEVVLNAKEILHNLKQGEFKHLKMTIKGEELRLEIVDRDEIEDFESDDDPDQKS